VSRFGGKAKMLSQTTSGGLGERLDCWGKGCIRKTSSEGIG